MAAANESITPLEGASAREMQHSQSETPVFDRDHTSLHFPHQMRVLCGHTKADRQSCFSKGSLGAAPLLREPVHGIHLLPT